MAEYLPYAGTNAIQEAVIGVHFQSNFPSSDVDQARSVAEADFKAIFPRSEDIHEAQLKIDNTNQETVRIGGDRAFRRSGFQMIKTGSDGKPSRVLRMVTNLLTVHFMEYDRWAPTLEASLRYILTILPRLDLVGNALQAFSLRYIDRFTFDGYPDDAKASFLIKDESSFVTKQCFSAGPFWHCHSGWFGTLGDNSRILNQLNIGSSMIDNAPTVTIDHNMICKMERLHNTVESFQDSSGGKNVDFKASLNCLHKMNRDTLSDVLVEDMSRQIGLVT
ncbi:MAG: TIGR04255 family protein [Rhodospirillaceae bacterium]|nr:TIGR04255 family protein [Rhodospirillaceae bacterium]